MNATTLPTAHLLRRLGAVLYDSLVLLALWFLATAILLPFTHGEAIHSGNPLYQTYLFLISFAFFAGFWTRGGQSIGMRAWRLKVVGRDGKPVTLWNALLRFLVAIASWAPCGLGFLWSLFEPNRRTWHDLYSETDLVVLPKL